MDGEFLSNTLYLEQTLGWSGLLIEPDVQMCDQAKGKHRRAWLSCTCLSPNGYSSKMPYTAYSSPANQPSLLSRLLVRSTSNLDVVEPPARGLMGPGEPSIQVQCFPLGYYLYVLNRTDVEYVSLDVEGSEFGVLRHFPWDGIRVLMWSIEHRETASSRGMLRGGNPRAPMDLNTTVRPKETHSKVVYSFRRDPLKGRDGELVDFMEHKGYDLIDYWDGDYTFVLKKTKIWNKLKIS